MSAKSFWNKAKANYWAGREQDVCNIYDNATNTGNARSSYNRAATVIGPQRQQLEQGYAADYKTYKRMRAAEERQRIINQLLANKPQADQYEPNYDTIMTNYKYGGGTAAAQGYIKSQLDMYAQALDDWRKQIGKYIPGYQG